MLQAEALNVFHLSLVHNYVSDEPEWILREDNLIVNYYISKVVNHDDWMLNQPYLSNWRPYMGLQC